MPSDSREPTREAVTDKWARPQEVSRIDMAFGGNTDNLMPPMSEIPREFHMGSRSKWNQMVCDWFYCGLANLKLSPREGIDEKTALRHIATIIGSFAPQHEHKEAACAYLLSRWFDDATYTKGPL